MDEEKRNKSLFAMSVVLLFGVIIFYLLHSFVVSPIIFKANIEDKTIFRGVNGTATFEIRNLAFYGIRDVSVESYILKIGEGGVTDFLEEQKNVVHIYEVKGFTSKSVIYEFDTSDFKSGEYRIISTLNYTRNYEAPLFQKFNSKDFTIKYDLS